MNVKNRQNEDKGKNALCTFYRYNACWYGNRCWYIHDKISRKSLIYTRNCGNVKKISFKKTQDSTLEKKKLDIFQEYIQRIKYNRESHICNICFENPSIYGILSNCDHIFCFGCIKQWRKPRRTSEANTQNRNLCPVCKISSSLLLKKDIYLSGRLKLNALQQYRSYCRRTTCRQHLIGKCKRGKKCWFSHSC